jgi:hypothetical protein
MLSSQQKRPMMFGGFKLPPGLQLDKSGGIRTVGVYEKGGIVEEQPKKAPKNYFQRR